MKFSKFIINILFVFIWLVLSYYVLGIIGIIGRFFYDIYFFLSLYKYLPVDLAQFIFWIFVPILGTIGFFFGGTIFFSKYLWFSSSKSKKHINSDEIKKYAELRDKDIITENEFQDKKKKLLDL